MLVLLDRMVWRSCVRMGIDVVAVVRHQWGGESHERERDIGDQRDALVVTYSRSWTSKIAGLCSTVGISDMVDDRYWLCCSSTRVRMDDREMQCEYEKKYK